MIKLTTYFLVCLANIFLPVQSQTPANARIIDALQLTLIGKALPTKFPYHRLDTAAYKGLSVSENQQARCTAGMALVFRTNSSFIDLYPRYSWEHKKDNMTGIASAGFDLYIKRNGHWVYAGTAGLPQSNGVVRIATEMDSSFKDCLLYLPIYSELESLKLGIASKASIDAIPNPFKVKTVFFGSSFTQGIAASRPGMSYPMQIQRMLNLDVCNLGFSGNSKLQPYFANMLADTDADAFVFDAFSNPDAQLIKQRLAAFVERLAAAHPATPLIFVETIHRARANFNSKTRAAEAAKRLAARKIMADLMKRYPNVHLIENPLPEEETGDTSADGVHPSDMGYYFWARNLSKHLSALLLPKS